ncbi:MAG: glycoside hydrolase family 2 TIM barrel-domain containing protein [Eubacteriales bacterium]
MEKRILEKWKFHLGDDVLTKDNSEQIQWKDVFVPHDWATMYPVSETNETGLGGGYAVAGIGWYETAFELTKEEIEKDSKLRFDGVYQNATVYVNGNQVGKRAYGYSSFYVDISEQVIVGKNILQVRVDNSDQPNSRWYTGSGILRPVYLEVLEKIQFANWPIFAKTNRIDYEKNTATLKVECGIENKSEDEVRVYVVHEIYDGEKNLVTSGSAGIVLEPGMKGQTVVMPTLEQVQLWNHNNPYLYTIVSMLYHGEEQKDRIETRVGVREVTFDCEKGFLINGEQEKIKGMCIHHDCGLTGGVGYKDTWRRKLLKLKDMGCNGIRCAHNPPVIELLDLCDELGFYVMDEAFDEWQLGKFKHHAVLYSEQYSYGYNQHFIKDHEMDLVDMIHRDRNHPSIVLWSIGNEILEQSINEGHLLARKLADICHREDSTRMITSACDRLGAPIEFGGIFDFFAEELDVVGYNYVDRWKDRGELLYEIDHKNFPKRCILGSENYSAGMIRGDYSPEKEFLGFFRSRDYRYATMQHEHLWKLTATRDYIAGDFLWTGIDYLGEAPWPNKGGYLAPIDSCGFEKDTYYYFRSIWNMEDITLHIAPHWNLEGKEGTYQQVIVYTNCKQVSLYLNGKLIGTKGYEFPHRGREVEWDQRMSQAVQSTNDLHLSFDVMYEPGELLAVGYDDNLQEICRKVVKTTGKAEQILTKVEDGEEYVHVEIMMADGEGNMVPHATNMISCETKKGTFLAMDNGDMLDYTLYGHHERKMFAGKVLALFRKQEGELEVELSTDQGIRCSITL